MSGRVKSRTGTGTWSAERRGQQTLSRPRGRRRRGDRPESRKESRLPRHLQRSPSSYSPRTRSMAAAARPKLKTSDSLLFHDDEPAVDSPIAVRSTTASSPSRSHPTSFAKTSNIPHVHSDASEYYSKEVHSRARTYSTVRPPAAPSRSALSLLSACLYSSSRPLRSCHLVERRTRALRRCAPSDCDAPLTLGPSFHISSSGRRPSSSGRSRYRR